MSKTNKPLKLAMGTYSNIATKDPELGKISYAFDTHNLYIDSKKKNVDGSDVVERQHIDACYATGLKDADGINFIKIQINGSDNDNLSFLKKDDTLLSLTANKLTATSLSLTNLITDETGSFKKIIIANDDDNNEISITSAVDSENNNNIVVNADNIVLNNSTVATKEYVDNEISNIKPDTSMTEIWSRGTEPPENKKLLWIRTGEGFGNGVLYYYLEGNTGMINVYKNWVPMSAIYT